MRTYFFVFLVIIISATTTKAQLPPVFGANYANKFSSDHRVRKYLVPQRIVWQSSTDEKQIKGTANLLKLSTGQAELPKRNLCILKSDATSKPAIVLDFGKELHGGLQLITSITPKKNPIKIRVRFGESVSEVMSDIDTIKGATNDHAMRDFITELPWLGSAEIGNTGFRFVRIDLVEANTELHLKEINAIFSYRDIPYKGSFKCSDAQLNEIWLTGAYTVHLNMQEYLWDGIKRDRLVWVGDMHPEVMTINSVFGYNDVVPRSLDAAKDQAPLPDWMNGLSAYSMWWIIIHKEWYKYQGDLPYLQKQKDYLQKLLTILTTKINADGSENLDGGRFLDWPSSENKPAVHAGLQSLMLLTFEAGAELCTILKDDATAQKCKAAMVLLKKHVPATNNSKQAAALMGLSGLLPIDKANNLLSVGGVKDFSTFYGYYMLQAKAKAGDYEGAMQNIKTFWGAMLGLGATTFWEDFNMDWLQNAGRIDELLPANKKDIHGDCGAYCYKGFRHSLCHGWASGPTSWLTEHVLGVSIVEPGCKTISVVPHLGSLQFAEGTFPTPFGIVSISHKKLVTGKIETKVSAPKGVKVIYQ